MSSVAMFPLGFALQSVIHSHGNTTPQATHSMARDLIHYIPSDCRMKHSEERKFRSRGEKMEGNVGVEGREEEWKRARQEIRRR
jgi:hypothetical protein